MFLLRNSFGSEILKILEEWNCGLSKTISVNEFSIRLGSWNGLSGAAVQCRRRIKVLGVFEALFAKNIQTERKRFYI